MFNINFHSKLPWRFQSKTNFLNEHSNFIFRHILKTNPVACNPASDVNYLTLVCHRDVNICILAIKSFLRFYNSIRITLQDDGSLTTQDIAKFKHHIPGIDILLRQDADKRINSQLNNELFEMRKKDVSFLKLIDVNLLFEGRRIVADSDILFLKQPTEVIDWIETKHSKPFYHQVSNANKAFEAQLPLLNSQLGTALKEIDYCSGFIGFNESQPLDHIIHITQVLNKISQVWGLEQNIYAFLLKERSTLLNPLKYLAIKDSTDPKSLENACMLHYVGKLKHTNYLTDAKTVINSLR
ncbi:MAG: hypothetical protein Q7U98_05180 [Methylicorpusculum sp.]|uniref:hypothetical protein n=1 Tax=Methylicorpusculum sp. TaxID=2713644 RepID=UPI002729153B|nr:hypothetical protein [Methylicorpusculum sp.]MDO8938530.1 hypothetical protein [Methylicorpusculum sp.]MDP2202080.1 hypothetical protein [Methylicorpusculum sp.]